MNQQVVYNVISIRIPFVQLVISSEYFFVNIDGLFGVSDGKNSKMAMAI